MLAKEIDKSYQKIRSLQERSNKPGISLMELRSVSTEIQKEHGVLKGLVSEYEKAQRSIAGLSKQGVSMVSSMTNSIKSAAGKIGSTLTGIAKSGISRFTGIGKSIGGVLQGIGSKIVNLAKNALLLYAVAQAFQNLRKSIADAFNSYLRYDTPLRNSITALKQSFSTLGAQMTAAFAPILSAIVPALTTLVNWCVTAANAVAAFIAAITGKSTYKVAVAGLGDVAGGASGAAGSLDGAAGAAKKLRNELSKFDELNVISQDTGSGGGGGAGGGGGGGGAGGGGITFTDANISQDILDFADKIKKAWKEADFTEIGGIIGEKLGDALDKIPWETLEKNAKKAGESLATLINGFVETPQLGKKVGKSIAGLLNLGISALSGFSNKIHGESVGTFVSDIICDALDNIKWKEFQTAAGNLGTQIAAALNKIMSEKTFASVGKALANALKVVIQGAYKLIGNIKFDQWGKAIATGINTFFNTMTEEDWKKAGLTLDKAVEGILELLINAVKDTNWEEVGKSVMAMLKEVRWGELLKEAGTLIWEAIKAAFRAWKGSFDAAPIETLILTAILGLKFIGAVNAIIAKLAMGFATTTAASPIAGSLVTGLEAMFGAIIPVAAAAIAGGFVASLLQNISDKLNEKYGTSLGFSIDMGSDDQFTPEEIANDPFTAWRKAHPKGTYLDYINSLAGGSASTGNNTLQRQKFGNKLLNREVTDSGTGGSEIHINSKKTEIETNAGKVSNPAPVMAGFGAVNITAQEPKIEIKGKKPKIGELLDPRDSDVTPASQRKVPSEAELAAAWNKANLELGNSQNAQIPTQRAKEEPKPSYNPAPVMAGLGAATISIPKAEIEIEKTTMTGSADMKVTAVAEKFEDAVRPAKKLINGVKGTISQYAEKTGIKKTFEKFKGVLSNYDEDSSVDKTFYNFKGFLSKYDEQTGIKKTGYNFLGYLSRYVEQSGIGKTFSNFTGILGLFTEKSGIGKTFSNFIAEFTGRTDSLSKDDKTINTTSKYTSSDKTALSAAEKTIGTTSKYTSSDKTALSAGEKTIGTTAKYTSSDKTALSAADRTINVTGAMTSITKPREALKFSGALNVNGNIATMVLSKLGGIFQNGSFFNIPQYAAGGRPLHGTAFIAGEMGAEIVGHIGGRTEVLNKSQIASAIYSAVVAGISTAGHTFIAPMFGNIARYQGYTDVNRINELRDAINASNIIKTNDTRWMDLFAERLAAVSGGEYTFVAQLNGAEIFRETVSQNELYRGQTGVSAFA